VAEVIRRRYAFWLAAALLTSDPAQAKSTCTLDTVRETTGTGFDDAPNAIIGISGRTYLVPRGTRFIASEWQAGDDLTLCPVTFFPGTWHMFFVTDVRRGRNSTIQAALAEHAPLPATPDQKSTP
jgi:hypothetical protein